jgi:hypothetical protein
MEETTINDNTTLIKKPHNIYKIKFKYACYSLINSLLKTKIIQGGSTDEFYKTLIFKAQSVKTFNEYMNSKKCIDRQNLSINEVAQAIFILGKQLEYLINIESKTIIGYNTNDIIVINDDIIVFLGSEMIKEIDKETKMVTISWPYSKYDFFISPEMLNIKEIPSFVHFKASYFSFACLIIYFLFGDDEFYLNYLKDSNTKEIIDRLNNHIIKETKIYWLLSRCLVEDINDRSLLLI